MPMKVTDGTPPQTLWVKHHYGYVEELVLEDESPVDAIRRIVRRDHDFLTNDNHARIEVHPRDWGWSARVIRNENSTPLPNAFRRQAAAVGYSDAPGEVWFSVTVKEAEPNAPLDRIAKRAEVSQ